MVQHNSTRKSMFSFSDTESGSAVFGQMGRFFAKNKFPATEETKCCGDQDREFRQRNNGGRYFSRKELYADSCNGTNC